MCGDNFWSMKLKGSRGSGLWGVMVSTGIRNLTHYPSEQDRATRGSILKGDIAVRCYWSNGWFRLSICHIISCNKQYARVKRLSENMLGGRVLDFRFTEWPRIEHSAGPEETCNRMELTRLPCDQGGNWKPRLDIAPTLLAKIDRALRSKPPPNQQS